MAQIKVEQSKQITSGLKQIVETTYEIPDKIVCDRDGAIMNYDEYYKGYQCSCCEHFISAEGYVKKELAKAEDKNKASKKTSGLEDVETATPETGSTF